MIYVNPDPLLRFLEPPKGPSKRSKILPRARQQGGRIVSIGSAKASLFIAAIQEHPEVFDPALVNTVKALSDRPDKLVKVIRQSRHNLENFVAILDEQFEMVTSVVPPSAMN